jgi:hypothetical protein
MSSVRTFGSLAAVLLAIAGLTGCYDLSTDGPGPEDFIRNRSSSAARDEERAPAKPEPEPADMAARLRAPQPVPASRSAEELEASEIATAPGGQRVE